MEKTFRLPSKFAQEWLTALRSGEYTQLEGHLIKYVTKYDIDKHEHVVIEIDTHKACCLGVAAVMCGATAEELKGFGMPFELEDKVLERINYPKELQEENITAEKTPLPVILAQLNDGLTKSYAEKILEEYPNVKFGKVPDRYFFEDDEDEAIQEKYSFEDIAKFIEDNVEFYEDEGV